MFVNQTCVGLQQNNYLLVIQSIEFLSIRQTVTVSLSQVFIRLFLPPARF